MAGDAVSAQASDDGRDTVGDDRLDPYFGSPGGGAALAASAQDVDVGIDQAGDEGAALRLDDLGLEAGGPEAARLGHGFDDAARCEDIPTSERLRREHLRAADQDQHGRLLRRTEGLN
jgi:hypothetical protein